MHKPGIKNFPMKKNVHPLKNFQVLPAMMLELMAYERKVLVGSKITTKYYNRQKSLGFTLQA